MHEAARRFLFLTSKEWAKAVGVAVAGALAVMWYTIWISPWIGISVGVCILTIMHMSWSSRTLVSFPHVAILIAALQYIFAAWLNFYWPPTDPTYDIGENLPTYLSYAGPAFVSIAIGWLLPLAGLKSVLSREEPPSPRLLLELDLLLVLGIVSLIAARILHVASLGFILLLLSNLRYAGVYGRMLVKGPGWSWRLGIVLAGEVMLATGTTMFHDLLLWSFWTFVIWIYCFKPAPRIVIACVAIGVLMLPALQQSKWQLRQGELFDENVPESTGPDILDTPIARTGAWLGYLGSSLYQTVTLNLQTDFISDIAVRYNQGWIINRVMSVVPTVEPYAEGETIREAAVDALMPRVLNGEKETAGGQEKMLRYAAMDLEGPTAMNLGLAGEMYANFGYWGGIIGCGVFTALFSLLFRAIAARALKRSLWWAAVPFIFFSAAKAEDDLSFVLNWTVKGAIVFAGVTLILPSFRRRLFQTPIVVHSTPTTRDLATNISRAR
jgi:hypothetical protein